MQSCTGTSWRSGSFREHLNALRAVPKALCMAFWAYMSRLVVYPLLKILDFPMDFAHSTCVCSRSEQE